MMNKNNLSGKKVLGQLKKRNQDYSNNLRKTYEKELRTESADYPERSLRKRKRKLNELLEIKKLLDDDTSHSKVDVLLKEYTGLMKEQGCIKEKIDFMSNNKTHHQAKRMKLSHTQTNEDELKESIMLFNKNCQDMKNEFTLFNTNCQQLNKEFQSTKKNMRLLKCRTNGIYVVIECECSSQFYNF